MSAEIRASLLSFWITFFITLGWVATTCSTALAHASLVSSTPADGAVLSSAVAEAELTFDEPVTPVRLDLVGGAGGVVALPLVRASDGLRLRARLPPDLTAGGYALSYRIVSADGHPVAGALAFSIGSRTSTGFGTTGAPSATTLLIWLSRVCALAGLVFGIGGVFFESVLAHRAVANRFTPLLLWVGVGGSTVSFLLDVLDAQGLELLDIFAPATWQLVMSFPFTLSAAVSIGAFALAICTARAGAAKLRTILALAALLLAATVFSLSGHASLMKPQWLGRGLSLAHGLVVIFWLGALPPLAARLTPERAGGAFADFNRFSQIALAAVGVLVVSGSVMAFSHLRAVGHLLGTPYGQIMSAKLILFCGMLGLAATNRFWLATRIGAQDAYVRRYLRLSIHLEIALGLAILSAVSLWRFSGPQPQERAPIILTLSQEALNVGARLLPRSPHSTALTLVVDMHERKSPREVLVTVSNPTAGVTGLEREARAREPGTWVVDELILPVNGTWHIDVVVLVSDFERRHAHGTFQW